jgi:hypothetical protein
MIFANKNPPKFGGFIYYPPLPLEFRLSTLTATEDFPKMHLWCITVVKLRGIDLNYRPSGYAYYYSLHCIAVKYQQFCSLDYILTVLLTASAV